MEQEWIGRTFNDRYEILELLGTGGMSSVYKANDPNLDRVVAIKIIHPHLSVNDDFIRRFRAEAQSVAQLRHPNIVQVFDFDTADDTAYIVFEYVPGENLQERLARMTVQGRVMSAEEVTRISGQIAEALDYAHARGLVHRDVKPANILLDVHGDAMLADFGIVKITDDVQHTATGAVIGTARYMSPEQIKGAQLDGRTDLYSLGIAMFEMASGQLPYQAESAMTIMMMHISDPVPDMDGVGIANPLGAVITQTLAKNPADRFATGSDLAAALRDPAFVAAAPSTAPTPNPPVTGVEAGASAAFPDGEGEPTDPPGTVSTARSWRSPIAIGGAIIAVALIIGIVVMLSSRGDDTSNGGDTGADAAEPDALAAGDSSTPPETVAITDIGVADGRFIVDYETFGYTEDMLSLHVHFYWNDIREYEAGMGPYEQDWFVWAGPRPFDGYLVGDRPPGATEMCAVVANPDHTVLTGTGNCMALP